MKPDMVKAMEYAKLWLIGHDECAGHDCTDPQAVTLARAFLALSADHDALVKRVESVATMAAESRKNYCHDHPPSITDDPACLRCFLDAAARLTEKAKP